MLNYHKITVIPNHQLIFGVARSLASPYQCYYIGPMHHLDDSYPCPKLPADLFCDLSSQSEYFESFLRPDCEIRLILVEANVYDLFTVHIMLYIIRSKRKRYFLHFK